MHCFQINDTIFKYRINTKENNLSLICAAAITVAACARVTECAKTNLKFLKQSL